VRKIIAQNKRNLNQTDPSTLPTVLLLSTVIVMFGTELHAVTAVGLNVNICEPMRQLLDCKIVLSPCLGSKQRPQFVRIQLRFLLDLLNSEGIVLCR